MPHTTDSWGGLRSDLAFAIRALPKSKGFSITAVLTLALGIGANTAVFSVVNGVLLRPLVYPAADRIQMLFAKYSGIGISRGNLSSAEMVDVLGRTHAFSAVGLYQDYQERGATLSGVCQEGPCQPERIDALGVTASVFQILGVGPALGRVFSEEEDRHGRDGVIVLSHKLRRTRFAADPRVVGRTVTVDGLPRVVIGIMPGQFLFQNADAYVPLALALDSAEALRGAHSYIALAQLAPGVTVEQANAQLAALAAQLTDQFPRDYPQEMQFRLVVQSLREFIVGDVRRSLLVLLGIVALVLLISCANVANLSLARAQARHRELAIRAALGARPGLLVRQVLAESMVLSLAGSALGVALAPLAVRALLAANPGAVPLPAGIQIDVAVLLVTLALAVLTAFLFGLLPAIIAARPDLSVRLRDDARGASARRSSRRARSTLIVAEVALAVTVLSTAGLMLESLWRLVHVNSGFQPDHVVTLGLKIPRAAYPDSASLERLYRRLTEGLATVPGVRAAALARQMPTFGRSDWEIEIQGQQGAPGEVAPSPAYQITTPRYFAALGIPLRTGRLLTDDDGREGLNAVVNETMARRFWPAGALGKRFRLRNDPPFPWFTIVGVVGDVRTNGPSQPAPAEWTGTVSEFGRLSDASHEMWLFIRTSGDPTRIVPLARHELSALDHNLSFGTVQTMAVVVADAMASARFTTYLLTVFAGIATVLAAIGVYGVLAYSVTQRRREFGIRLALGARASDVVRLVISQGVWLAIAGVMLGLAATLATSQVLRAILFETPPRDPITFAIIASLLITVAVAASWVPARRAASLDPVTTLSEG